MLVTLRFWLCFCLKMTGKNTPKPVEKPAFHKVAENLYRLESSNGYYALLKRGGKQFRRSLKTKDRKLADRRLNDLRAKIGCLKISQDAKLNNPQAAKLWLETNRHAASSGTVMLGVHYFSIYRLIQRGKLKTCRALRGKLLVPRTELLKLLGTE